MRIIAILLALYLLGSCEGADPNKVEECSGVSDEVDTSESAERLNSAITDTSYYVPVDTVALNHFVHIRDSVEKLLDIKIDKFLTYLQANDFEKAQELLHPSGVYYYTFGQIPKKEFNRKGLENHTGLLDGAYSYALPDEFEESDSIVNGLFWLDSLKYNYTNKKPDWHEGYGTMAYGFTGNYSSDHIDKVYGLANKDSLLYPVAYIYHNSAEIDHRDVLMLEFFQDDQNDWKLYAIGNLEWTP
ncbi:MAG: hypothetical protein GQ574_16700 [Crocinitomix sp.]|nr:hypothetical protein [Crocinitomix sp.]